MAKQKIATKVTDLDVAGAKMQALAFGFEKYVTPLIAPETNKLSGTIALYGTDNQLDKHIVDQYRDSATHSAIVKSAAKYITGDLFTIEGASPAETKILFGKSAPRKWLKATATSKVLYSGFGILITYSRTGKVARFEYIEYGQIRKEIKEITDEYGEKQPVIVSFQISPRWKRSGTQNIKTYPPYNPERVLEFKNESGEVSFGSWERVAAPGETVSIAEQQQLFVYDEECPGSDFYPTPGWWGADKAIKFDALYFAFHTNNISKGFMPTVILEVQGVEGEEDLKATEDNLKKTGGATGDRVIALFPQTTQEGKPTVFVHPIDNHMHDGKFEKMHASSIQAILTAHQVSSPVLVGLPTTGNLSPNAGERESALELYMSNVIRDSRQDILDAIQMIFTEGGRPEWSPKVVDSNPYANTTDTSSPDAKL